MRILGIELGSWSLKAVEMESRFRRIEILDLHEILLPLPNPDPIQNYKKAIESLMARLPSHPEKIVTSLPPAQTALRFLKIPVKQRKKAEQMYRFELEDNIPFKLEDAIVEHYVTKTKEGHLVFAAIAPKRHIVNHVQWLKMLGLDPDWLTFEGMGNINLYLSSKSGQEHKKDSGAVLMLDLGHTKTNLSILHEDRLETFRNISWGGLSISQSIALGLNIPIQEAENKKINVLDLNAEASSLSAEENDIFICATQALSNLVTDISHSLVAYRSQYQNEVNSILITGGTSKLRGLISFLGNSLGKPVELFHPLSEFNIREEIKNTEDVRFGEAVGRALVFARQSTLLFNFRKQELGKGTSLTEVTQFFKNPGVVRLAKYIGLVLVVLFIHVMIATPLATSEATTAQEELRKVFSDTFKGTPSKLRNGLTNDPKELKKFIDLKNKEMEQKLKIVSKNRVPMLSLIRSISETFGPDTRVDVNTLMLDDRNMTLEGVLYQGDINKVTDALKKIPSLSNVTLQQDKQRFVYQASVVGR